MRAEAGAAIPVRTAAVGPALYVLWAAVSIALSVAVAGLNADNVTRLLVVAFLLLQLALRRVLVRAARSSLPALSPRARFVLLGTLLACVVEGFHMISHPVYPWLRVGRDTPVLGALGAYAVDLLVTVPAYLVIFTVIFAFAARIRYPVWSYAVLFALAQLLGDGGIFFFAKSPGLLLFLPYPMTNYHAMNVLPLLAVEGDLAPKRPADARSLLALPAVVATYLVLGAAIQALGRWFGPGRG